MAEDSGQDKTEQATPKRRDEAKEKGNVAKSQELNSVIVIIAAVFIFNLLAFQLGNTIKSFIMQTYMESSSITITIQSFPGQAYFFGKVIGSILMPVMISLLLAGLLVNYAQIGAVFASKALIPDFKKISPLKGIKRMFSSRAVVELVKGMLKILILGLIGYQVISKYVGGYLLLSTRKATEIFSFTMSVVFELAIKVGIALFIMAIADVIYQRWKHDKDLRMTKQEVKDENKQQENPELKGRIRSVQRQIAAKRMMAAVPEATVVVTNPTHIAIALKYEPSTSQDAPTVIAKGKFKIAEKIIEIAAENEIPVIENKPLAWGLFDTCEIGMEIPLNYYQAVAEILSQIYQGNKEKYKSITGPVNAN